MSELITVSSRGVQGPTGPGRLYGTGAPTTNTVAAAVTAGGYPATLATHLSTVTASHWRYVDEADNGKVYKRTGGAWVDTGTEEGSTAAAQAASVAAAASAVAAAASEAAAEVAQDLTEDARDTALLAVSAVGVFVDTTIAAAKTTALGATSVGETFLATGSDVDYVALFRHDSGPVATDLNLQYPKVSAIPALASVAEMRAAESTTKVGTPETLSKSINQQNTVTNGSVPLVHLSSTGRSGVVWAPTTGSVVLTGDGYPTLPGIDVIVWMGQSLNATGIGSLPRWPARNVVPVAPNMFRMFPALGLRGLEKADPVDWSTLNLDYFVSAYEKDAETRCTGFMAQKLAFERQYRIANRMTIMFNVALGGGSYAEIKKGGTEPAYANFLTALQAVIAEAGVASNVRLRAVIYDRGQTGNTASKATAKAEITELYDDVQADKDILLPHQTTPVPFIIAHIPLLLGASADGSGHQDAQLELHQEAIASPANRRIFIGAEYYASRHGDIYHTIALHAQYEGAWLGQSLCELLYGGTAQTNAFWMTEAEVTDTDTIVVTTNALASLTTNTAIPGRTYQDWGITLYDGATPKTITSITFSGVGFIIEATGAAPGWTIDYGKRQNNPISDSCGPGGGGNIVADSIVSGISGKTFLPRWMTPNRITVV